MDILESFEIVKCGPYRFVGKSVHVGNNGWWPREIFDARWIHSDRVMGQIR